MTMQAGFEALSSEAGEWDDASTTLSTAAATASGLTLSSAQFSALASSTGVDSSYADARQFVQDVLEAGQRETKQIADALRAIRADFQSTDATVVAEVKKSWVPE